MPLARCPIASLSLALALAPFASAAQRKLNPPLARDPAEGGVVHESAFSPDGSLVVLRGDERAGILELFVVPSDGSAPAVRLHPALPDWADVTTGGTFDAGGRVLFLGDLSEDERYELWSAPIGGGGPIQRLSAVPVAGGDVESFRLTADGSCALYRADQDVDGKSEIYVVPTDGSAAPARLNGDMDPLGDVISYQLSPDGECVAYRADQDQNLVVELYVVWLDSPGTSVKLNAPLASGAVVSDVRIGTASDLALFRVTANAQSELWSVPLDGSAPAQLVSGGITAGMDVEPDYALSPDGDFAVYRIAWRALYSSALAAPAPVRLSAPIGEALALAISEDSATVVFHESTTADEVRSIPIAGGTSVLLWSTPQVRGQVEVAFAGAHALITVHDVDDGEELISVPADGSGPPIALGGSPNAAHLNTVQVVGDRVLFLRSMPEFGLAYDLVVSPLDGSAPPLVLNAPLLFGGVGFYHVDPAGTRVLYPAQEQQLGRIDLYTRLLDASEPTVRISPLLDPGPIAGDVSFVASTSDGSRCVYLATQDDLQSVELYAVDTTGAGTVCKLSPPVASGRDVRLAAIAPDDERVVFSGDLDPDAGEELYVAPLDGSAPAVRLAGHAFPYPGLLAFSTDGLRAVYTASGGLWSVLLDGSAPALRISTGAPGNVNDFALAGERAAFRTNLGGSRALYSAPLDGGAAPVLLQAAGTTTVTTYLVAADATCVVYRADAQTDEVYELFRVPLDGSTAPVKLNPPLPTGGDVTESFELDPASGRVVYAADGQSDEVVELYSVPLDGSEPAVRISGTLVAGGDVSSMRLTPSGRAVFVADAVVNNRFELFSVILDGSAPRLVISGVLPTNADVAEGSVPLLAPEERVVYRATTGTNTPLGVFVTREEGGPPLRIDVGREVGESLFDVKIIGRHVTFLSTMRDSAKTELSAFLLDGWPQPFHLHAPLVAGGNVTATVVAGDNVLYLADAEANDVVELYYARLPLSPTHAGATAPGATRSVTRY